MKNYIQRIQWFLFSLMLMPILKASADEKDHLGGLSVGQTAGNILVPVNALTNVIYNICYIVGVAFVLGSVIRFKEYRENPSQTPISRPIVMAIFGLVIFVIPFIAKLSSGSDVAG